MASSQPLYLSRSLGKPGPPSPGPSSYLIYPTSESYYSRKLAVTRCVGSAARSCCFFCAIESLSSSLFTETSPERGTLNLR